MRLFPWWGASFLCAASSAFGARSEPVLPLVFVENTGQFDRDVAFGARSSGIAIAVARDGFAVQPAGVRFTFEGSDPGASVAGLDPIDGRVNFLVGAKETWRTDCAAFRAVSIRGLYPGIDLEIHTRDGVPEYDVVLDAGADLSRVVVRVDGIADARFGAAGGLSAKTRTGTMRQDSPVAFERHSDGRVKRVECGLRRLAANRFAFTGDRRATTSRVIDPGLEFSTLIGGTPPNNNNTVADGAMGLAVDDDGEVVVAGYVSDVGFPVTAGAFDTTFETAVGVIIGDAFVARFDAEGKTLRFATFIGGNFGDQGYDVALDANHSPYVVGYTASTTFPTTATFGASTVHGLTPYRTFIAKLDPSGSSLAYGVVIEDAMPGAIVVDGSGAAIVTGSAAGQNGATGFPVTPNALDPTYNGGYWDEYLLKLHPSGASLVFATLLGGSGTDNGARLALDANGGIVLGGRSDSPDFPTFPGAFDSQHSTFSTEATIGHFDANGLQVFGLTLLGADHATDVQSVRVLKNGNIVVAGGCWAPDGVVLPNPFPVTPNAFDTLFEGDGEGFVSILDPNLQTLVASTLLGGQGNDSITAMDVDASGRVIAASGSDWGAMPVTADAVQSTQQSNYGYTDGVLTVFSPDLSQVEYGSYLGGNRADVPIDIAVPIPGVIHVAGRTSSTNFPTTTGAFDRTLGGYGDAFLARIEVCSSGAFFQELAGGCAGAGGVPLLRGDGCPRSGELARLRILGSAPGAPAVIVAGAALGTTPVIPSCALGIASLFAGATTPLSLTPKGAAALPFVVPPILSSVDVYLQSLVADPTGHSGITATNVLRVHAQ